MCNKLKIILNTMKPQGDEVMTKAEMVATLQAVSDDMEHQSEKISKVENIVGEMRKTQSIILEMVQNINKKLNDDKIEEKAYLSDKMLKVFNNWVFWAVVIGTVAFAGMGVLKVLDKADNIATISKAIK